MDGYRDLYRAPVSAGYYTSRYQPGYSVVDPLYSAYTRVPLDAYSGYGAPVSYQPELISLPRYSAPVRSLSPRRRINPKRRPSAQAGNKRRPPPVQSLAPNRKPFKKSQKNLPVENSTPKKGLQKNAEQRKPQQKLQKGLKSAEKPHQGEQKGAKSAEKPQNSSAATLAKETQELHDLFRTGVDPSSGKSSGKPSAKKVDVTPGKKKNPTVAGQKRKADSQKKDETPSSAKKSRSKAKNKKLAKDKEGKKDEKPVPSTPKAVKAEPPVLTEEEKQEMEELQSAACKAVGEFLGVPEKREEPEKAEGAETSLDETKPDEVQANPDETAQEKPEEAPKPAPLTPEEEKELEEKGYKFFAKLLEDNQELRKLYLDKKDAGTFECLVCRSIDPETSKKFTNVTSLVMHTSMRKQKRPEHRGYGHAVCDVLGWEALRGPKRPVKQVKEDGDLGKQPDAEKVPEKEKSEENQKGPSDE